MQNVVRYIANKRSNEHQILIRLTVIISDFEIPEWEMRFNVVVMSVFRLPARHMTLQVFRNVVSQCRYFHVDQ
jgi:hypothetical protein